MKPRKPWKHHVADPKTSCWPPHSICLSQSFDISLRSPHSWVTQIYLSLGFLDVPLQKKKRAIYGVCSGVGCLVSEWAHLVQLRKAGYSPSWTWHSLRVLVTFCIGLCLWNKFLALENTLIPESGSISIQTSEVTIPCSLSSNTRRVILRINFPVVQSLLLWFLKHKNTGHIAYKVFLKWMLSIPSPFKWV